MPDVLPPSPGRRLLLRAGVVAVGGLVACFVVGLALWQLAASAPSVQEVLLLDLRWLALGALCVTIGTALHGARLRPLLVASPGHPLPGVGRLCSLYLAASLLNLGFPGPAGEVGAALVLRRRHGLAALPVVAASLGARLVGLALACGLALLALPLVTLPPALAEGTLAGTAAVALVGLVGGAVALRPRALVGGTRWLGAPLRRTPLAPAAARAVGAVERLAEALSAARRRGPGPWLRSMLWSLASMATSAGTIACAARACGIELSLTAVGLTFALTMVASVALALLPGGLGTFDVTLTLGLIGTAGLSPAAAALVLVGVRAAQLASILLSAIALVAWMGDLLRRDVVVALEAGDWPEPEPGLPMG